MNNPVLNRRTWLCAAAATWVAQAAARSGGALTIATGNPASAYDAIGKALARQLGSQLPGSAVQAIPTAGGIENLEMLRDGRADIGFANASASLEASLGMVAFARAPVPVRVLGALYPNSMHLVTRRDTGIARMADVKGKRLATGAPGSGTEVISNLMLEAVRLRPDQDLQRERLGIADAVQALRDKRIDAFLFGSAVPVKPIADVLADPAFVLGSTADALEGMNRVYRSIYRVGTAAPGTYPNQAAGVSMLEVWDLLVTTDRLPAPTAHAITRMLFERQPEFIAVHPNMRHATLAEQARQNTVSFHLGSRRYLAEQGLSPFARQMPRA